MAGRPDQHHATLHSMNFLPPVLVHAGTGVLQLLIAGILTADPIWCMYPLKKGTCPDAVRECSAPQRGVDSAENTIFGRITTFKCKAFQSYPDLGVEAGGIFPQVDHDVLLLCVVLKHDLVGFTPDA